MINEQTNNKQKTMSRTAWKDLETISKRAFHLRLQWCPKGLQQSQDLETFPVFEFSSACLPMGWVRWQNVNTQTQALFPGPRPTLVTRQRNDFFSQLTPCEMVAVNGKLDIGATSHFHLYKKKRRFKVFLQISWAKMSLLAYPFVCLFSWLASGGDPRKRAHGAYRCTFEIDSSPSLPLPGKDVSWGPMPSFSYAEGKRVRQKQQRKVDEKSTGSLQILSLFLAPILRRETTRSYDLPISTIHLLTRAPTSRTMLRVTLWAMVGPICLHYTSWKTKTKAHSRRAILRLDTESHDRWALVYA